MSIKRFAILPLALAVGAGTLLIFHIPHNTTFLKQPPQIKCCKNINEREPFISWDIISQSLFRTKV